MDHQSDLWKQQFTAEYFAVFFSSSPCQSFRSTNSNSFIYLWDCPCGSYFLPYVVALRANNGVLTSMNEILYLKIDSTLDAFPHGIFVNFELGFLTHFREIFPCNTPTKLWKTKTFPPEACNFIEKETLARVFSCEFCEIFKNTFLYRTRLFAVSARRLF